MKKIKYKKIDSSSRSGSRSGFVSRSKSNSRSGSGYGSLAWSKSGYRSRSISSSEYIM